MKVSMEKQLVKKAEKDKSTFDIDSVNEVKLLLESNALEDSRILRGLSKQSQFTRIEDIRGKQLELEKFESEYQGNIYTLEQIKSLAVDYRLRFLQAYHYTGALDIKIAGKIKEFAEATGARTDEGSLQRDYYILAPQEMFDLKEVKHRSKAEIRAELKRQLDPILFYQVDANHYRLIHKWGEDFTVFRYLEGFRWKNWWNLQLTTTAMVMPLVAVIFALVTPYHFYEFHSGTFWGFTAFFSFVVAHFTYSVFYQDELDQISKYFSPTNWNSDEKVSR